MSMPGRTFKINLIALLFFCFCKKIQFFFYISVLLQVGDRVVALPEYRAWAELCAVSTKFVYKIPDELSFQDAAAILINYLVAYIILFDLISLRPGKSVVVHSAAGGVVSTRRQFINFFCFGVKETNWVI